MRPETVPTVPVVPYRKGVERNACKGWIKITHPCRLPFQRGKSETHVITGEQAKIVPAFHPVPFRHAVAGTADFPHALRIGRESA